jgi:hypothetical protein
VAAYFRDGVRATAGDQRDNRPSPTQQLDKPQEWGYLISPGRRIDQQCVAVVPLKRRVMAAVDPPGWGHRDDWAAESGFGDHLAEQCEQAGLRAAGNDHRSGQHGQFDQSGTECGPDSRRGPTRLVIGAAVDDQRRGAVRQRQLQNLSRLRRHIIYVATNTPTGLMFAAANHNDVMCRTFGETQFGPHLDSELKAMMPGGLPDKLFTYARYNIELDDKEIKKYGVVQVPAHELTKLDAVEHIETMIALGKAYAKTNLKPKHLAGFKEMLPS